MTNPIALVSKLSHTASITDLKFFVSLAEPLQLALFLIERSAPDDSCYSAHKPKIEGYNELAVLVFSKKFIMWRLDSEIEAMLCVYHDSKIVATDFSRWVFANLLC